jgi:hypothetical protein
MKLSQEQFEQLLSKASELNNTTVEKVLCKGRGKRACVETRQMVSKMLKDVGYGWTEIARMLNRTHGSIINNYDNHEVDYSSLNYYEQSFDRLRKYMALDSDEDECFDEKLISENERLRNEVAKLREQIFDIKLNSINLTKSLKTLCN